MRDVKPAVRGVNHFRALTTGLLAAGVYTVIAWLVLDGSIRSHLLETLGIGVAFVIFHYWFAGRRRR